VITSNLTYKSGRYISGKRFETKFNRVVDGIGQETAHEMTPQAQQAFSDLRPVVYPIDWQTEKQRRAYFATDGFGKGIPTKRTGEHTRAWVFIWKSSNGGAGVLTLQNPKKAARFIFGGLKRGNKFQQRMHKGTWPEATAQRDRLFESARRLMRLKFKEALGSFGFIETGNQ
jgi:hypothetical protein